MGHNGGVDNGNKKVDYWEDISDKKVDDGKKNDDRNNDDSEETDNTKYLI